MMKKVTIVIPTYKRPNQICRAVDSALNQTYSNIEIIVVDDNGEGSPFEIETEKKLQNYVLDNKITYLKNKKNSGGSFSRNQGLFHSKGEYITFLDDDDEISEKKIEEQVKCLEEKGDDYSCCYCQYHRIDTNGNIYNSTENIQGDVFYYALSRSIDIGSGSNLLVRTEIARKIGGYDISFKRNQDLEFMVRLLRNYKLAFVNKDLLTVHNEIRELKLSYQDFCEIEKHYLETFYHDIQGLSKNNKKKLYKRVALERFYFSIVSHNVYDAVKNLFHNHVGPITFTKYCFYLVKIYITKRPYSFKL